MDRIAIKVENLSKCYRIGLKEQMRDTLGGALMSWIQSPVSNFKSLRRLSHFNENGDADDVIWALKEVSFEVKQGEVVGIIGRNGAGKSTVLKVLSRITEPTSGRAIVKGRVSSLLEVGTGFHPELTGRQNVYLNGAILGMSKQEIDRKFDEIVAFAEVEKFVETPVKRYSSGMKVRLAFAVAAYLEPEILLVDEVLAVGDFRFQRKCLSKMRGISQAGRTVLFVSHNMAAITALCEQGILLDDGQVRGFGQIEDVISQYLAGSEKERTLHSLRNRQDRDGNGRLRFTSFRVEDHQGKPLSTVASGQDVVFVVGYAISDNEPVKSVHVSIIFIDGFGRVLFTCSTTYGGRPFDLNPLGGYLTCSIPGLPLVADTYSVDLWSSANGAVLDNVKTAHTLQVVAGDFFGTGRMARPKHGPFLVRFHWSSGHA